MGRYRLIVAVSTVLQSLGVWVVGLLVFWSFELKGLLRARA